MGCRDGATLEVLLDACSDFAGPGVDGAELVSAALAELSEKGLLEFPFTEQAGATRRQVVKRMAGVGAAAFSAPLIISAAAKTPYAAAYGTCTAQYQPCVGAGTCCTGLACTNGGAAGSMAQKYCGKAGCTPKGSQPMIGGKASNCNASNLSMPNSTLCCSGTCDSSNKKVCF
jgi:hypothetical protein